jgi:CobQ-like glutamine amidotransferase family enzyme
MNLKLTWMYPDLMSTYGDRGNIQVLTKRAKWRDIEITVVSHILDSDSSTLIDSDIIVMGGAQDRQQKLVSDNLHKKSKTLKKLIEGGVPGLFICGAYQFLGNYYKTADGTTIPGLEIFDLYTVHPGDQAKRIIGNIVTKWGNKTLVGFENHGGRTYLGKTTEPFAIVEKGGGNNGEDGTEGVFYKNSIGTYLHGPILPKNPDLADWILATALKVKYQKEIRLAPITNILEDEARNAILTRLQIRQ